MTNKFSKSTLWFIGVSILVYALLQILVSVGLLNTFWNTIIRLGAVMAIVSIGLNLIYGFNGQFSLGQWGFYAIGAYSAADVTYRWTVNKSADGVIVLALATLLSGAAMLWLHQRLSRVRGLDPLSAFTIYLTSTILLSALAIWAGKFITPSVTSLLHLLPAAVSVQVVLILAVLFSGVLAAEISYLFGLPILSLGSDYFGIATLGFTVIVKIILDNSDTLLGFVEMKGARGMVGIPKVTSLFWVFFFLVLVVILVRNLLRSSYGRAVISVREDEIAAKAMGIDVAEYKIIAFVLGSFLAGLAGGLYAHINGFLHPDTFNFIKSFDPMIIIVFGGLGSISGTVFAAFAWALVLEGALRIFLPQGFETWRFVVYPLLLLIVMLLRPKGIFGDFEIPFLRQVLPKARPKKSTETSFTAEVKL
ncbi:MAG TPA: branched-chain amino acid ABC transporter permease [Anaerolineales bacterium]|nr:branched-chain amino acid ABC transporter permease [Anaerolineales bacterium]